MRLLALLVALGGVMAAADPAEGRGQLQRCSPQVGGTHAPPLAPEAVAEHLVAFLAAGFRAAVPAVREH